jgi:hypothetical protein
MVAQSCNPEYSGVEDQEDLLSRPALAKISSSSISTNKLGVMFSLL